MKYFFLLILLFFSSQSFSGTYKTGSDITDEINADIENLEHNGKIFLPEGDFYIDVSKSIKFKSNMSFIMQPKTRIYVKKNGLQSYKVFSLSSLNNVNIIGGQVVGDNGNHLKPDGEWGMGIDIRNSENIYIGDINISKMWGDGIYIGEDSKSVKRNKNIKLNNINLNENRRQGITIISGNKIFLENIIISNTKGVLPSAGVDIEPNDKNNILKEIYIKNITTLNNDGAGIQIGLQKLDNRKNKISIKVLKHKDYSSNQGLLISPFTNSNSGFIYVEKSEYLKSVENSLCILGVKKNNIVININKPLFFSGGKENYFCRNSYMDNKIKIHYPVFN
ncbi:right-handed parallel beta-helix repeat-containing protein [Acinetobacter modestus]|uniref:right-handed parallel beta-helix repeat-containing protein n=1 Tax=Acinetobacter modestus TaxID=1776740 RepID=UPI001F4A8025|nr:right-handed parallel beta-helix repeat-containing protein [Acinetobacter modestus]MCH7333997.1 right-handed parallel beta-helix repeat-containing protein [Acinetobacter modestus]